MQRGTVFDIKEFAVYDGPGMRQTVFLKGCPLRCNWCHNPEGLSARPQLMVSEASCTHCGRCRAVCPLTEGEEGALPAPGLAWDACTACGKCIQVCPLRLRKIAGTVMTPDELVAEIRKNSGYYAAYGGGVTFSGGEPLMQAEFLMEVLDKIPDLHRAIETSGYADSDTFRQVVRRLEYVMMDLKVFDSRLHRKYIGVDNRVILDNALQLCRGDIPFVIRIPVIPGVNDNEENFRRTAEWISGASALEKVELLPYHKTAGAKYSMVGETYSPLFDTEQKIAVSQQIFTEYGIRSEVL